MYSEKRYFSIGEVSKLTNVTVKALRYYHDIGLLVPNYINESNGYRYYSLDQFIHLDIIKSCRDLGVSIKELQELFAHEDMNYLKQCINNKNIEIQEKINQLEDSKLALQMISNKITESQTINKTLDFHVDYFPERYLINSPITQDGDFQEIIDHCQLEFKMNKYGIKSKYKHGTLYKPSTNGKLEITAVFELVDKKDFENNKFDPSFIKLHSGYFLTYIISKETEQLKLKQMQDYLSQRSLQADFILMLYLYTDMFNTKNYHCQAQAYIGKNPPSI